MGSVNKVILVGNLGADPELRHTPGGAAVANLRIATTEVFKDKDGNRQEKTEWHRVSVWGKQAEHCGQYLAKGRQVYVEGSLATREWTDKDGVKRYSTEVKAFQVTFLGSGREDGGLGAAGGSGAGGGSWGPSGGGSGGRQPQGGREQRYQAPGLGSGEVPQAHPADGYPSGPNDSGGDDGIPF